MDVYIASDGSLVRLNNALAEFSSIEHLFDEVSRESGVVLQNVLLFLADGRELKAEVLEEAWDRGGEGGTSSMIRTVVYLFDRETFFVDAETSAARYAEEVLLPPQLPSVGDVDLICETFLSASDHIQHLQSLFLAQSNALSIAYANLFYHLEPFIQEFETFAPKAEQELDREDELIRGSRGDMAMLSKIVIHEQLRKKERDKDKGTMADFVNPRKMEQVRDTCRTAHESHVERWNTLVGAVTELRDAANVERHAAEERSIAVKQDFEETLERVHLALDHARELVSSGAEGIIQGIVELDQAMREEVAAVTNTKNDFTLDLHLHLRQIASFQVSVVDLAPQVNQLETDLSPSTATKAAFPHLVRLRHLPFAYAATVVEVVRRKEFGRFMNEWTGRLRETLINFTAAEMARRQAVKEDVISHIPFSIPSLDDSMKVGVELSVTTGVEALKSVTLDRRDVDSLLDWVESIRNDPDILRAVDEGDPGPIQFLETNLEALISRMDTASDELDKLVETEDSNRVKASLTLSAKLRAVEKEREEHARQIQEIKAEHDRFMNDLKGKHEKSSNMMQHRQGELQEELMRLRTDLEEEMMARQALSAQLEENVRDQEERQREQDDHAELVTALQAEVAQEKDRATDLGVRLQEALLDVDGLRNAEQTLVVQLQTLQDERSKSSKALSDEQAKQHALESQLAGLRAELEATSQQLTTAQAERDTALKNQSAEAERLMRDHIAEADGDRAVLEHQNLTLNKQLDDLRLEMQEKLTASKNQSIRQADGLKAELQFVKAQLRTSQQKESVLADQLAMLKDSAEQSDHNSTRQHDIAKDAVGLVGMYHETCMKLLKTINASSTISGSSSTYLRSKQVKGADNGDAPGNAGETREVKVDTGELKDSSAVMVSSLATAQAFDLAVFAEAVQRTITLVKKWGKSCKSYRDLARNRISFTNFTEGDLALFLPTRNAAARAWACFNVSAPHNFLKVDPAMQDMISNREWIIARISSTEEAVASGGESPTTNPFGLADGLRYWVHTVEEYTPTIVRTRRSASAQHQSRFASETGASRITPRRQTTDGMPDDTPGPIEDLDGPASPTSPTRTVNRTAYFTLTNQARTSTTVERPSSVDHDDSSQSDPTPARAQSPQVNNPGPSQPSSATRNDETVRLSPVSESFTLPNPPPTAFNSTRVAAQKKPMPAIQTGDLAAPVTPILPAAQSPADDLVASPPSQASRPLSRTHHRNSSRLGSPSTHPPPLFAPATFGRPASVASNHSFSIAPFATSKAAPAMAITTSNPSGEGRSSNRPSLDFGTSDLNPFMETTRARRQSSSTSLFQQEDFFTRPSIPQQYSGEGSPGSSGFQSLGTAPTTSQAQNTHSTQQPSAAAPTPSPGTSPGLAASRLIRGLSLRKKTSNSSDQPTLSAKPSAMDMLRRFDSGS